MKAKKQIFLVVMLGIFLTALATSCFSITKHVQSLQETTLAPSNNDSPPATISISDTPIPVTQSAATINFRPGSLLTNENRSRIYYITSGNTARRIESWMTFYALGFQREAVLTVDDAVLDQFPLSGHLTRHLYDHDDYRYWAVDGFLWAIDAWQPALTVPAYRGIPPTPIDSLLLAGMPVVTFIPDDILMRDGVKLYIKQGGSIYPVVSSSVYQAYGYKFNQAIEIPHGVMTRHDHKSPLTRFLRGEGEIYEIVEGQRRRITLEKLISSGYDENDIRPVAHSFLRTFPIVNDSVSLHVRTPVVNLRQGPGTGYKAVQQVFANEKIIPLGRTPDNSWFKARYQGKEVWVAAKVVDLIGELENLPIIEATIVYSAPEPTSTPLGPLVCNQFPIRGFGKVWANHINVQHRVRCPLRAERGIEAAVQKFQSGFMIWVEQDSIDGDQATYVFFDDNTYNRFSNVRPVDPAVVGHIPAGFYSVSDKFSAIYWEGTGSQVKERLGYATTPPMDSPAAFQQFSNGWMFWLGAIDRIFVVVEHPSGWDSFEDTFN